MARVRQPERMEEISHWLREGRITPADALQMAIELRRRRTAPRAQSRPAETEQDPDRRVQAVIAELERMVGLGQVKALVRELQAYIAIQLRRAKAGLASEPGSLHMIFTGNPGTGKTTVARLLGRLFKEMGVLPKGHTVEVERADLVGEYIGHTAQRTRDVVRRALGGLLLVDEAYALARGGEKDFGKEAIDHLVRAMEEHRGELVVIFAGYPDEMAWFLRQNPGLRSRIALTLHFPDYTAEELIAIAEQMLEQRDYRLTPDGKAALRQILYGNPWLTAGENGNARAVRNLVERAIRRQALRLVDRSDASRAELMAITRADLESAVAAMAGVGP